MDLRDRLRGVAAWEPILSDPAFSFGEWVPSSLGDDGATVMPWFRHNENAGRFAAEMAALGFVGERAWMDWGATPEGRRLIGDPAEIATATVDQLHKLVTAAVRGDRFVEGNLAAALETGKLLAIVRRARELADAEETGLDR